MGTHQAPRGARERMPTCRVCSNTASPLMNGWSWTGLWWKESKGGMLASRLRGTSPSSSGRWINANARRKVGRYRIESGAGVRTAGFDAQDEDGFA